MLIRCDIDCDALEELTIGAGEIGAFRDVAEFALKGCLCRFSSWVDLPSLKQVTIKRSSFKNAKTVIFDSGSL